MNFDSIWNILQAALGVGLVIFVHEAGHFMAARWCKVKVEVFSLGFGPKIFGWTRGDTVYQIAAVPLGGYVRMAGEDMYDQKRPQQDGDLGSKSVPQRLLIYSGGVVMNMLFALIVFPIILMIGVPFNQPMVTPIQGGAAWLAGIEDGTVVEEINGDPVYAFMHIGTGVALADEGKVELLVREPGASDSRIVEVQPTRSEAMGLFTIDVGAGVDPDYKIFVAPESEAEKAGLKSGYKLLSIAGDDDELSLREQINAAQFNREPLEATFETETGEEVALTIDLEELAVSKKPALGVNPLANRVRNTRQTELTKKLGLAVNSILLAVNDQPIFDRYQFSDLLNEAQGPITITIEHDGFTRSVELGVLDQPAIRELAKNIALESNVDSARIRVNPGTAAERAGIQTGDVFVEIDGTEIKTFSDITPLVAAAIKSDRPLAISLLRDPLSDNAQAITIDVTPAVYSSMGFGFALTPANYVYKADDPLEAIQVGLVSTWRWIEDAVITVKGMLFTDRVEGKNLGSIITIAVAANDFAASGLTKLFFFLCLLSVNLAFLNVLPIPVLDGGHMAFLLVEAIKGSPVSERVMGYSQLVGLMMILSLMIYVIKNDIVRFFLTE